MDPSGKVAIVSGASRGIGEAIAIELAHAGADVAVMARSTDGTPNKNLRALSMRLLRQSNSWAGRR